MSREKGGVGGWWQSRGEMLDEGRLLLMMDAAQWRASRDRMRREWVRTSSCGGHDRTTTATSFVPTRTHSSQQLHKVLHKQQRVQKNTSLWDIIIFMSSVKDNNCTGGSNPLLLHEAATRQSRSLDVEAHRYSLPVTWWTLVDELS